MSYFFYKYLLMKSAVRKEKTSLYFTKLILKFYKYLPFLLKSIAPSFHLYKTYSGYLVSKFYIRLFVNFFYNLIISYQVICSIRILIDYYAINLNEGNRFMRTIRDLTEPYFELVSKIMPKNAIGSLFGFYLIYVLSFLLKYVYLFIGKYHSNLNFVILANAEILLHAVSDEKIILS